MNKRSLFFCCIGLALLVLGGVSSAANGSVVVDRVVAVVNDDIITMSDLQREVQKQRETRDERLVLEDMIDRKLQMAEARKTGMDVTDKELDEAVNDVMRRNGMDRLQFERAVEKEGMTFDQYRSELREQMTMSRLINKYVRTGLSLDEKEMRTYYEKNLQLYAMPEEVRVRHLVVTVPAKATAAQAAAARDRAAELLDQLKKGGDFIALIRQHSGGPTASLDGDTGFLRREHLLPEIEDAVRGLKPGEYAGPVKSADGYHLVRLEETRTPVQPFEKVREEIARTLGEQKLENTYRAWLQTLRTESHIENRL
ncbi:MAG: peptidyl-prolyl cis-trans isomerase [Nitrospirota bacterium]|nr:peptidyl-prolyl cis-trans isomerase [Nitrospirota bacterium]